MCLIVSDPINYKTIPAAYNNAWQQESSVGLNRNTGLDKQQFNPQLNKMLAYEVY